MAASGLVTVLAMLLIYGAGILSQYDYWKFLSNAFATAAGLGLLVYACTGFVLYLLSAKRIGDGNRQSGGKRRRKRKRDNRQRMNTAAAGKSKIDPKTDKAVNLNYVLKHEKGFQLFMSHLFNGMLAAVDAIVCEQYGVCDRVFV